MVGVLTRSVDQPLLGQYRKYVAEIVPAEGLVPGKRQLERRALDVIDEDVQVVGIDQRPLRRAIEEIRRVADNELIERRAARDEDGGRPAGAATRASRPLPGGGNRAGIPGHHRHVERADVDAELERVGRHHRADRTLAQALLDLAAPVRQVPATVPANALGRAGVLFEVVLQVRGQDLGGQSALRKHDDLQLALEKLRGDTPRF